MLIDKYGSITWIHDELKSTDNILKMLPEIASRHNKDENRFIKLRRRVLQREDILFI